MDKLKQLVQDKSKQKDPIWAALYNSDLRSLYPKYELTKIQKSKIKYDKFRLMMQNIDDFLYIEKHRKDNKMLLDSIDNIKEEIQELEKCQDYHYQIGVIKERDNVEAICQELTKYGTQITTQGKPNNTNLTTTIQKSQKWQNYFQTYCQKPKQISQQSLFIQKIQLASTIQIPSTCDKLNDSTCSSILMNRYKKMQFRRKLFQKWVKNGEEVESGVEVSKEFGQEWKGFIKDIDFKQFV